MSAPTHARALPAETVARIDGWWRAANYLSVGQIYLLANPLLREPLTRDHVKPRLLGHFGTAPGLNLALIDPAVRRAIDDLEPLAPLHNAPALDAIDEAMRRFPNTPQVAVFDTLFHASMPPEAREYAVPRRWRDEWGVRRYGFHGLSSPGRPSDRRRCWGEPRPTFAWWCATSAAGAR